MGLVDGSYKWMGCLLFASSLCVHQAYAIHQLFDGRALTQLNEYGDEVFVSDCAVGGKASSVRAAKALGSKAVLNKTSFTCSNKGFSGGAQAFAPFKCKVEIIDEDIDSDDDKPKYKAECCLEKSRCLYDLSQGVTRLTCGSERVARHPNGGGLVSEFAYVDATAFVDQKSAVCGRSIVLANAKVQDWVRLSGRVRVFEDAVVRNHARITGDAVILNNAVIEGHAVVAEDASIRNNAKVSERARVWQGAIIANNSAINGHSVVGGKSDIGDNASVSDFALIFGGGPGLEDRPLKLRGNAQVKDFVELSQSIQLQGDAVARENAILLADSRVFDKAEVSGEATLAGHSRLFGESRVFDNAVVLDNAQVAGQARVFGESNVLGNAKVSEKAQVYDKARVLGNAQITGEAQVFEEGTVQGNALLFGTGRVHGRAILNNNDECGDGCELQ